MDMKKWLELDDRQAERFGDHEISCKHNFADSGLFTDEKIARLIESYPREHYNINTMNRQGEQRFWRDGEIGDVPGEQVLDAIRNGQIWLSLHHIEKNVPEMGAMVREAFEQIAAMKPGYRTWKHNTSLLVSSPGAKVHCHADVPMIALWHVRGRKRVYLWDPKDTRFLPEQKMESIVLREIEEDGLPYEPSWDESANVYDLEPGDLVAWPLNAPHRVDNLDSLNMSLTTEYLTTESQRSYGVHYANGILRRRFGFTPKSRALTGPVALAKCAGALAYKKLKLHKAQEFKFISTFRVDPTAPDGVRFLPPEEHKEINLA